MGVRAIPRAQFPLELPSPCESAHLMTGRSRQDRLCGESGGTSPIPPEGTIYHDSSILEVPLTRAVNAGHRFVYDELRENLAVAQRRVEAVLSTLANR